MTWIYEIRGVFFFKVRFYGVHKEKEKPQIKMGLGQHLSEEMILYMPYEKSMKKHTSEGSQRLSNTFSIYLRNPPILA